MTNRFLDYDPNGRMYVLVEDLARVRREESQNRQARADKAEPAVTLGLKGVAIQPLTVRVNQGECLRVTLRNDLLNDEQASFHLHGSALYVVRSGTPAIATNPDAFAAPGQRGPGMRSVEIRLPADTSEADLIARVDGLSRDPEVDGILVQLPLPKHISEPNVLAAIDPLKDVDGLTEASAGKLVLGKPGLRPCTPIGTVILARTERPDLAGANVVVIGRSILVGNPAALLFLEQNASVTIAHSKTRDLRMVCRGADILVAAVGRPEMVRGDWIRPGAIVIDVGTNGPFKARQFDLVCLLDVLEHVEDDQAALDQCAGLV